LALPKGCSFLLKHTDDCVRVAAYSDDFADRRFVREQPFLNHFTDDDYPARKLDVFVVQVATVAKGVSVGRQKTSVRPDDEKTRRRFNPVVNGLCFYFVSETKAQAVYNGEIGRAHV